MPVVLYRPLDGLSVENYRELMQEFDRWSAISGAFLAGPNAREEVMRQGVMAMFNKAEEMGIIEIKSNCTTLNTSQALSENLTN